MGSQIGSWIGERFIRIKGRRDYGRADLPLSCSALGVYDGNVYETLYKRAQLEPLNKTEIPEGYEVRRFSRLSLLGDGVDKWKQMYIKPMLERGQRLAGAKL